MRPYLQILQYGKVRFMMKNECSVLIIPSLSCMMSTLKLSVVLFDGFNPIDKFYELRLFILICLMSPSKHGPIRYMCIRPF